MVTYAIPADSIEFFNKLLNKAQKKAEKLGVEPIAASYSEPYTVEAAVYTSFGYVARYTTFVNVTMTGTVPMFNGWSLIATVSPLATENGDVLPVVMSNPGVTTKIGSSIQDATWCDHCKVRRDRTESFIVRHEDGTEKQVGRNCLKDFTGDERMSPAGLASLMNTLSSIGNAAEEFGRGPRRFDSESLTLVLACTISSIRKFGWVSSRDAYTSGKTPTKTYANEIMHAYLSLPAEKEQMEAWTARNKEMAAMLPTEADFAKAGEYRQNLSVILDTKEEAGESNDYLNALRVISVAGTVNKKAMGIACSIIVMVDRDGTGDLNPVKTILTNATKTSKPVGEPKKRQVFSGVTFIENFHTGSGFSIATFVTADGNILKSFSKQDLKPGQVINLKATVVRHDIYKGTHQTIVNRPVVVVS